MTNWEVGREMGVVNSEEIGIEGVLIEYRAERDLERSKSFSDEGPLKWVIRGNERGRTG